MKIIQSTDTFQRSRRLPHWDNSGEKWQSEHSASPQGKVTPQAVDAQTKSKTLEPVIDQADLRGEKPEAISFKRQAQHDTFNGAGAVVKKANPMDVFKTVGTLFFGFACVGFGVFAKNRI